ncbi:dihydrolipoamide acetyltransferase family protein [Margalitia sp. FSL K6-0131]|uniref:dihydrolipoamide acetyltransferase family protein n=1 Tax=Margalitia sp. FSL K6-0131 TaxID=2954604 RepID=UPI0030F79AE9
MASIITMPKFGLTMTEGTLSHWNKSVGERVEQGEPLYEVETDKITNEIEAPQEGVIRYIFTEVGQTVQVGAPLAIIAEESEDITELLDLQGPEEESKSNGLVEEKGAQNVVEEVYSDTYTRATPYAKKLAREQGISMQDVEASGPRGIILSHDVMKKSVSPAISPLAKKYAEEQEIEWQQIEQGRRIMLPDVIKKELEGSAAVAAAIDMPAATVKPITGMRKVIAERMSNSWQQIPHVTISREVDVTPLLSAKAVLDKNFKISITHFLIKIIAAALQKHPVLNAWFQDKEILYHHEVNMGIAVSVPEGLLVPVLKRVDQMDILEIAELMSDITSRAKEQKLRLDETQGGTFTISNLGMMGVEQFTPIINPPETGILGVGRIIEKPVFIGDGIVRRSFMSFSLSFDHRALDGAEAANFLQTVEFYIQEPIRLLMKARGK